ncbi:hypothetical protein BDN67DRAFT_982667 [Paxillus ammoniavirescens]|nr:hypothetical protein BDN67DRAFT_982667 [Paxillus ammoniavirescens]
MKTFLTLLAAIASLSAHALVGVHAVPVALCYICPSSVNGHGLSTKCTDKHGILDCHCSCSIYAVFTVRAEHWIPHWEFGFQVPEQRDVGRWQCLFFMLIVVSPNTSRHTKEGTQSFLIMPLRNDSTSES